MSVEREEGGNGEYRGQQRVQRGMGARDKKEEIQKRKYNCLEQ